MDPVRSDLNWDVLVVTNRNDLLPGSSRNKSDVWARSSPCAQSLFLNTVFHCKELKLCLRNG